MPIQVGDKIPSVILKHLSANGMEDHHTDDIFADKKIVLFGIPGAFTPTCTAKHLPGYLQNYTHFRAKNIDVACLAVNDPFVLSAWAKAHDAEHIAMLADGNATFTKALGLEMDGSGYGLGTRSKRFALYAHDGVVKAVNVEKPGSFEVSSAEAMLKTVAELEQAA